MDDPALLRYSRHILLPDFDLSAQQSLLDSRVLLVGAGGLGSAAALYLAAAGVGHLTIVDDDQVELSNLQRQIIHHTQALGRNKAESATETIHRLNPDICTASINQRLSGDAVATQVAKHDVIIDASDNFATRYALNRACVMHRVPLVSGAAIQTRGLLTSFDNRQPDGPCYQCLFDEQSSADDSDRCSENGVFAPLTGVIGTLQAAEAIKLITGWGHSLHGRLLGLDIFSTQWRETVIKRDPACPVCALRPTSPANVS